MQHASHQAQPGDTMHLWPPASYGSAVAQSPPQSGSPTTGRGMRNTLS